MNKFNSGYKIWSLKDKDYYKADTEKSKITVLLQYASLAASTFNSQPWKCKIIDNSVKVYIDKTRVTQKSDKSGRFAYVSIGCFLENLKIAAQHYGCNTRITYEIKNSNKYIHVANVKFIQGYKPVNKDEILFQAITTRVTNRSSNPHKDLPHKILKEIQEMETIKNQVLIYGKDFESNFIRLSIKGDKNIWTDFGFRKEHVAWIRNNLTFAHDGMPAFGIGANTISSFMATPVVLSPIFPFIQIKKNISILKKSKNYLVVCSPDSEIDWIKDGMLYERINLLLSNYGIAISPMGQLIEDESTRMDLKELTKKSTDLSPQIFFRIAYAGSKIPHCPRMTIDEILLN